MVVLKDQHECTLPSTERRRQSSLALPQDPGGWPEDTTGLAEGGGKPPPQQAARAGAARSSGASATGLAPPGQNHRQLYFHPGRGGTARRQHHTLGELRRRGEFACLEAGVRSGECQQLNYLKQKVRAAPHHARTGVALCLLLARHAPRWRAVVGATDTTTRKQPLSIS